jgi:Tol biopolymer transport system component
MARGSTLYLQAMIIVTVLVACAAVLLAVSQKAQAAFPGKNGRIAFVSDRDGDFDIYTVRPDGSDLRRVTNTSGEDSLPEWSPDGTKIAFTSNRDGDFDIYVKDLASGQVTQLTDNAWTPDSHPAWSPDGSQIAFASLRDCEYDLWVMNADGSNERRLTDDCFDDLHPAWSPDGSKIVFMKHDEGTAGLYRMDPDGSDVKNLTNPPGDFAPVHVTPEWSPNGARIAWVRSEDSNAAADIWKMAADGSQKDRLTFSPVHEQHPSWSPDGGKIVFVRGAALVKMNKDGTNKTAITDASDYPALMPDWQPKPAP